MNGSKGMHRRFQRENCRDMVTTGVWEVENHFRRTTLKEADEQAWQLLGSRADLGMLN